jgi:hypothetical protein
MSDHELERMRADYARQTAAWHRVRERLAQLPRDLRISVPLLDESSEHAARGGVSIPLPPGLRG